MTNDKTDKTRLAASRGNPEMVRPEPGDQDTRFVDIKVRMTNPRPRLPCMIRGCENTIEYTEEPIRFGPRGKPLNRPYFCDVCKSGATSHLKDRQRPQPASEIPEDASDVAASPPGSSSAGSPERR